MLEKEKKASLRKDNNQSLSCNKDNPYSTRNANIAMVIVLTLLILCILIALDIGNHFK